MENWLWLATAILVTVAMTIFKSLGQRWCMQRKGMNWPPGPKKLPLIGNFHQLKVAGEPVHVNLTKLAEEHGGLMTIWFGSWGPTIVVSDPELAWQVLVSKSSDFSSRYLPYMSRFLTADGKTISTSDLGPYWYKLRNGLQSTTLCPNNIFEQTPLQEEDVSDMLISLSKEASSNNGVARPLLHLRRNTIKLIAWFCFGEKLKDIDVFVDGIDHAMDEIIRLSGHFCLVAGFEFLRYIPGLKRPFTELQKVRDVIQELIHPYISNPKFSFQTSSNDCYLQYLLSQNLCEDVIICIMSELFLLAVDSVSTTTAWALAFLIHNPRVQQKLYEEVSREVETEAVKVENVKNFQYLNAVVKETMRMKPIAPLAVPHKAARDSTLGGTKIIAGTPVVVNLFKLLHDPNIWVEPQRFMPERFLASSDIREEMERAFLPFGAGRRMCAGAELAKLQIALTLASLVKKFYWSSVVENQLPDLSEEHTFILMMKTPLAARITPRTSQLTPMH